MERSPWNTARITVTPWLAILHHLLPSGTVILIITQPAGAKSPSHSLIPLPQATWKIKILGSIIKIWTGLTYNNRDLRPLLALCITHLQGLLPILEHFINLLSLLNETSGAGKKEWGRETEREKQTEGNKLKPFDIFHRTCTHSISSRYQVNYSRAKTLGEIFGGGGFKEMWKGGKLFAAHVVSQSNQFHQELCYPLPGWFLSELIVPNFYHQLGSSQHG